MTPPPASPTADPVPALLEALEAVGPRPVLAWYGEEVRVELSGHVLANWIIKAIGHLADEIALEPGETTVVDLAPHWKRIVVVIATFALGADLRSDPGQDPVRVLFTSDPASPAADEADDVLAVEAASLSPGFPGTLPPLVHDWAAEVRSSPDRLMAPLPAWSGPDVVPSAESVVLVPDDGLDHLDTVLGVWLAGGRVVCPASAVTEEIARAEGVTTRL